MDTLLMPGRKSEEHQIDSNGNPSNSITEIAQKLLFENQQLKKQLQLLGVKPLDIPVAEMLEQSMETEDNCKEI